MKVFKLIAHSFDETDFGAVGMFENNRIRVQLDNGARFEFYEEDGKLTITKINSIMTISIPEAQNSINID